MSKQVLGTAVLAASVVVCMTTSGTSFQPFFIEGVLRDRHAVDTPERLASCEPLYFLFTTL